jgi:glyoxylase-like metal-dependent hydrolase (beta-lactamase superfamily II)
MPVPSDWFDVREAEPGVFIIEEPLHRERVKSYLVVGDDIAVLIDTGMGIANIRDVVESLTDKPVTVMNSHAHWDHVGGNQLFEEIWIHPAEAEDLIPGFGNERMRRWFAPQNLVGPLPEGVDMETLVIPGSKATGLLSEGQTIDLGGRVLEVLHCPGHSPGGVVFLDRANGILFSTDVAYKGYLYVYGGDWVEIYRQSLVRLAGLAPELRAIYPSHNDSPIAPDLLSPMADALQHVIDGAQPTSTSDGMATYDFGEIGIYLFPPRYA